MKRKDLIPTLSEVFNRADEFFNGNDEYEGGIGEFSENFLKDVEQNLEKGVSQKDLATILQHFIKVDREAYELDEQVKQTFERSGLGHLLASILGVDGGGEDLPEIKGG